MDVLSDQCSDGLSLQISKVTTNQNSQHIELFFVLGEPLVERVRIISHLCNSLLGLQTPLDHVDSHDHLSRLIHHPFFLSLLAVTEG